MTGFFARVAGTPGMQNAKAAWRMQLGERFEDIEPLLKPAGKLAASVPCDQTESRGCSFRVIQHSATDIVGVCDSGNCEPREFVRGDIMVVRLDVAELGRKIAESFGLRPSLVKSAIPEFQSIGDFEPVVGYRFPIYLATGFQDRHRTEVHRIIAGRRKPPATIWFSPGTVDSATAFSIEADGGINVLLDDIVSIKRGSVISLGAAENVFGDLEDTNVPAIEENDVCKKYHLPSGAVWEDVTVKFQSEVEVTIKCDQRPSPECFHYSDLGLANKKNRNPTLAWELFKLMASNEGELSPPNAQDSKSKGHKQKELLSKKLRSFFMLEDEPIPWATDIFGWRTRFRLYPEGFSR